MHRRNALYSESAPGWSCATLCFVRGHVRLCVIVSWWSVHSPSRARLLSSQEKVRRAKQSPDGHRVEGKYAQHSLVEPLPPINRCSRGWHCSCCSPRRDSLFPHLPKNLTASFFALPRIGGSREGRKHWWVQNAGLKLVVGKINFRSKKIGGSRKVNWWVRNFCPHAPPVTVVPVASDGAYATETNKNYRTESNRLV